MNPEVTGFTVIISSRTICFDGQDAGKLGFDFKSGEG